MEPSDEDRILAAADDVNPEKQELGPIPLVGYGSQSDDVEIARALGVSKVEIMRGDWPARAAEYRRNEAAKQIATGKQVQAQLLAQQKLQAQQDDPVFKAQSVYARLGNIGAARVISKSRGPALFQHGEEVNLGKAGRFYIAPSGYLVMPDAAGKPQRYAAEDVIKIAGVTAVPFLGGDEAASEFRRTVGRVSSVMEMLDQLEDIYDANGTMIMPLSDGRNMAKQIESQLPMTVQQIRSGSNSAAGISDAETKAITDALPRRTGYDTLGDQERQKLVMVRQQLRRLIMDRASRNGIDFREMKPKDAKAGALPQAQASTNKAPAGLSHLNGPK